MTHPWAAGRLSVRAVHEGAMPELRRRAAEAGAGKHGDEPGADDRSNDLAHGGQSGHGASGGDMQLCSMSGFCLDDAGD